MFLWLLWVFLTPRIVYVFGHRCFNPNKLLCNTSLRLCSEFISGVQNRIITRPTLKTGLHHRQMSPITCFGLFYCSYIKFSVSWRKPRLAVRIHLQSDQWPLIIKLITGSTVHLRPFLGNASTHSYCINTEVIYGRGGSDANRHITNQSP